MGLHVVVGGQFGSEAKGHVVDWLTRSHSTDVSTVIRVAGPNAGHTAYDDDGQPWALRQVPCAAVSDPSCWLGIAAGSEVDPEVLLREIARLDEGGHHASSRLIVDPTATVLLPEHIEEETGLSARIGSTGKGIGAARAARIRREAPTWQQYVSAHPEWKDIQSTPVSEAARRGLSVGKDVIIEGTQGYGLGLHAGYYPFCTSSDCRAIDFLAMAGLSPWTADTPLSVWIVFRTYPIRVAGPSGPMFQELDWQQLSERTGGHVKPERTTVTQKVRRVGEWDRSLAQDAMRANGHPAPNLYPVLTFFDYWYPELAGVTLRDALTEAHLNHIARVEQELGARICALGTGPATMIPLSYP